MAKMKGKINRPGGPPKFQYSQIVKAIRGSKGVVARIARKLGCKYDTAHRILRRKGPTGDRIRAEYRAECERAVDLAEQTVQFALGQRKDLAVALKAAMFYLNKKRPDVYGDKATLKHEHSGHLDHNVRQVTLDVNALKLAPDVKAKLLEALDIQDQEEAEMVDGEVRE